MNRNTAPVECAVGAAAPFRVTTQRQGPVLTIMLASPATRNALDEEMIAQLGAAIKDAEAERSVRAVFLTAQGPAFCDGGSVKMDEAGSQPWPAYRRGRALSRALMPLMCLEKPVVVGVNGTAVGGGIGLALSGDVVLAAQSSSFHAGWLQMGAMPDMGVLYNLPRLLGMARAKNFLFGSGTMSAQEAAACGLALRVVPDAQLAEEGFSEAMRLAEGPAEVIGLTKALMARSFESSMTDMLSFEGFGQVMAMSNVEFQEGMAAHREKRPPDFVRAVSRLF